MLLEPQHEPASLLRSPGWLTTLQSFELTETSVMICLIIHPQGQNLHLGLLNTTHGYIRLCLPASVVFSGRQSDVQSLQCLTAACRESASGSF